jgi:cytochrome b6-f complex iron-sulfur subunit
MKRSIDRYVDSLARRRRPKPFSPSEEDLAIAQVAIELAAAAPEAQEPREAFVEDLRRRIGTQVAAETDPDRSIPGRVGQWSTGRRRLFAVAATTAAAGVVGAGADHVLSQRPATAEPGETASGDGELTPIGGAWQTVALETDLDDGGVLPFDLGAVTGFVRRVSGRVHAVSGTCTHQGCRLNLHAPQAQLACPCHGATFTLDGEPLTHPHNVHPLPALPRLAVRVQQGQIQVLAPNRTTSGR